MVHLFSAICGLILNYTNFRISLLEEGRKFHFTGMTDQLVQIHALVKLICSFKKMRVCYLLYSFVPNM